MGELLVHRVDGDAVSRFHQKYEVADNGCWRWVDRCVFRGYANLFDGKRQVKAHRWSYEHFIGPIPPGMQVDHVCHNRDTSCLGGTSCLHRRCVNPAHLEAVSNTTNYSRSQNHYANRTHCKYGHEFTPENTAVYRGARRCMACRKRYNEEMARARAELSRR